MTWVPAHSPALAQTRRLSSWLEFQVKEAFKRFQSIGKEILEQQILPCSCVLIMSFPNTHLYLHLSIAAMSEPQNLDKKTADAAGPDQERLWAATDRVTDCIVWSDDPWPSHPSRTESKIAGLPGACAAAGLAKHLVVLTVLVLGKWLANYSVSKELKGSFILCGSSSILL